MNHITTTDLLENLKWRYATKQFDPAKTIAPEIWTALEDALVLTPSSYGLQPWKFLIITSSELREQLKPLSWNQSQVTDCSHYVVFAIKKNLTAEDVDRFMARTVELRGGTVEAMAGYRSLIVSDLVDGGRSFNINDWSTRQTYIALGNFMTSAALLGVDTCPMEGIEPVNYDRVLGLSAKGFTTVVACAAGYRSEADKYASLAKVRFPKSEILETL
ncbi:NAD(P)H-dependent oxidoreductase [Microcoleus asticus]|uniref:NAD(P)H nitroreductase n=1 Tax=Microcoleus asticus IPMA8 TaxID=2563858 RepID=A0ABX2CSA9_9CYAN|nr:NAD(P)H-dependent oxidoreductase [Microcoleus asticus]NQE33096.1 putative NAD(P)H nitroreductase [Microcoleus asticus IPMA8]